MSFILTGLDRMVDAVVRSYVLLLIGAYVAATIAVFVVDWPYGFAMLVPAVLAAIISNTQG